MSAWAVSGWLAENLVGEIVLVPAVLLNKVFFQKLLWFDPTPSFYPLTFVPPLVDWLPRVRLQVSSLLLFLVLETEGLPPPSGPRRRRLWP